LDALDDTRGRLRLCAALALCAAGLACATVKDREEPGLSAAVRQAQRWDQAHQSEKDGLTVYYTAVMKKVEASWKKPPYSESQSLSVRLDFDVDRSGRVARFELIKQSGYQALDLSAIEAIKSAEPYPPLPAGIDGDHLRISIELTLTAD
jgi:protein TonB